MNAAEIYSLIEQYKQATTHEQKAAVARRVLAGVEADLETELRKDEPDFQHIQLIEHVRAMSVDEIRG